MLQVVTGTLAEIAANPVFAEYVGPEREGSLSSDFGILGLLAGHATLSPMCTPALAESWSYTVQFPLGGVEDEESNVWEQGYGFLALTMLNPNGVPESYGVDLWLTGDQREFRYNVIVAWSTSAEGWAVVPVSPDGAPVDKAQFAADLHAALHEYPSALVVDA